MKSKFIYVKSLLFVALTTMIGEILLFTVYYELITKQISLYFSLILGSVIWIIVFGILKIITDNLNKKEAGAV